MKIREISSAETLALRSEVLRPGRDISACKFDGDDAPETRHFGAVDMRDNILGIVSVYRQDNPVISIDGMSYQIRAMATAPACRGRGLGNLLLTAAENYAKSCCASLIWANARSSAIGFYTKAGFAVESEEFMIDGVGPHYLVTKLLTK